MDLILSEGGDATGVLFNVKRTLYYLMKKKISFRLR